MLYLSEKAYDKGDVEYITFRNVEIGIGRISGSADNTIMSIENTLDNNPLGSVKNMRTPPLNEPFFINEATGELIARENVGSHRVSSCNNRKVVFGECGNYRYLFAVTFRNGRESNGETSGSCVERNPWSGWGILEVG